MTRKRFLAPLAATWTLLFVVTAPTAAPAGEFSYVGTDGCKMCHKSEKQGQQYTIWKDSLHAQAFEALKKDEAKKIAKERGLTTSPEKSGACLKCHATGYDVDKARLGAKFRVEDGVQCETCHGPGSAYKSLKVMKDRELALKNGLLIPEKSEESCTGCHNAESPTFASFDFEKMWAKIAHPLPAK